MSERGDDFLCDKDFAAASAMLAFGQTGLCAGRRNCRVDHFVVSERSDVFNRLGLRRKRFVGERCRVGRFAHRFAGRRLRDLLRRFCGLGLDMLAVALADAGRGDGAVVCRPLVGRRIPVMSERRDLNRLGLRLKRRVLECCGVGRAARFFAGRVGRHCRRVDSLGFDVLGGCLHIRSQTLTSCSALAVVFGPGVGRFAPYMIEHRKLNRLGLRLKRFVCERRRIGAYAGTRAVRLKRDFIRRCNGFGLNVACVALAHALCRYGAVVFRPDVGRSAPVMTVAGDGDELLLIELNIFAAFDRDDLEFRIFAGLRCERDRCDRRACRERRLILHGVCHGYEAFLVMVDGNEQVFCRTLHTVDVFQNLRIIADGEPAVQGRFALGERDRAVIRSALDGTVDARVRFRFFLGLFGLDFRFFLGLFGLDCRFFFDEFGLDCRFFDRFGHSDLAVVLHGFRFKARHDVRRHELFAAHQRLEIQFADELVAHDLVFITDGCGREGTVHIQTGCRPYTVAEGACTVELPACRIRIRKDVQDRIVAVLVAPVEVRSVVVDGVVLETRGDTGVIDQRRRTEGDAVRAAVGLADLPDLSVFIQEVVRCARRALGSAANRDRVRIADTRCGEVKESVRETAVGSVFVVRFRLQIAEDQVFRKGVHKVVRAAEGSSDRRHAERHNVVLAELCHCVRRAIDRVDVGGAEVVRRRIQIGGARHHRARHFNAGAGVVTLRPGREVIRVEVGEEDVALFVPDRRTQFLVDRNDRERALAVLGLVCRGGRADRCRACRNRGDDADFVDRCNALIGRRPGDRARACRERRNLRGQRRRITPVKLKGCRRNRDGADAVWIDLIADRGLDVEVDLVGGCGTQTEGIVVVAHVPGVDLQRICRRAGCVVGPVVIGIGRADVDRIVGRAGVTQIIAAVHQLDAGGCGPDAGRRNIRALDVRLAVRTVVAGLDRNIRCADRVAVCACRVAQDVTCACLVDLGNEVIIACFERVGQHVHFFFDVRVVIDFDRICRFVARVVADERRNVSARVCDRIGHVKLNGIFVRARCDFRVLHAAVEGQNADVRDALIVACGDGQRAAGKRGLSHDFRCGIVNRKVEADERALAELAACQHFIERCDGQIARIRIGHIVAVLHRVVFGNRIEADANSVAFLETAELVQHLVDRVHLCRRVLPCSVVHMIPCAVYCGAGHGRRDDSRYIAVLVKLGDRKCGAGCRTDQIVLDVVDLRM